MTGDYYNVTKEFYILGVCALTTFACTFCCGNLTAAAASQGEDAAAIPASCTACGWIGWLAWFLATNILVYRDQGRACGFDEVSDLTSTEK